MLITLVPFLCNDPLTKSKAKLPSSKSEPLVISTSILSDIVRDFVDSPFEQASQESLSFGIHKDDIKNEDLKSDPKTPNTASLSNRSGSNPRPTAQRSKLNTNSRAYDTFNGRHSPEFSIF
jgi:hypothetical protein